MADNVISHLEDMKNYLQFVRGHPECNNMQIPLGRGLEVTYRLKDDEFGSLIHESLY